ncbi:MAG TPA: glycosyltransferase [Planctomycetota bacterium]|nr:glycosyltransferase [Planctomycetota bacterium]
MTAAPLRALHVNTNAELGGGERQVLALVAGSRARGVDARLLALESGPLLAAARAAGLDAEPLKLGARLSLPAVARIAKALRDGAFDVIHLHDGVAATLGIAATRLERVPAIVHRRIASALRRGLFSRWKYAPKRVARFIAVSQEVAAVLRAAGIPPPKIAVVPSGVDLRRLDGLARAAAPRAGDGPRLGPRLGTVAKLAPKKGVDVVLRAFARVAAEHPGARLTIVGGGPELDALLRLAQELGVAPRVAFEGPRPDGASFIAELDLFLFASELEGSPGAVREAMALRVPVVAAAAPGTVEVLASTGVVVPRGDPAAMAAAALDLLRDRARADALREAARARVAAEFSIDAMVDRTLAVACEVVARS